MNFYEQEMRKMFGDNGIIHDAKFTGKTMLGKLDDELRVKLQFVTGILADHYNAIRATIINRKEGVVDQQLFRFSDIIGMQKRRDMSDIEPHIWEYGGKPEWYVPITASAKAQIADTVLDYVGMYRQEENMGMTEMNM